MRQLKKLSLGGNALDGLPAELRQLENLEDLGLGKNAFVILPDSLLSLSKLRLLYLWGNPGLSLKGIGHLLELRLLHLRGNDLTEVPTELAGLSLLISLSLEANRLRSLPRFLETMATKGSLTSLLLEANPELGLPDSMMAKTIRDGDDFSTPLAAIKSDGFQFISATPALEILRYYFAKQDAANAKASREFREARLVVVGHGFAGKSSLAKCLITGKAMQPKENKQTLGIDILDWDLPEVGDKGALKVRIWDFGGQEVMHTTHQRLFMGEEAIYIVVVNMRESDPASKVHYWLQHIRARAPKARVLVALNHSEDMPATVNVRDFLAAYPENLPDDAFHYTSCTKGTGIQELTKSLLREFAELREPWLSMPESFFQIKDQMAALKQKGKPHVSMDYYYDVCEQATVADPTLRSVLLRYLDHAGLVVCFQPKNDGLGSLTEELQPLGDRALLEPSWLIQGIYSILNHAELKTQRGLLHPHDLRRWLDMNKYRPSDHEWLLELMERNELAFQSDSQWYVPPLLEESASDEVAAKARAFDLPADALRLHLRYKKTLPEGIIGRFIVRTHRLSPDKHWWRDGILLEDRTGTRCTALVNARWDEVRGGQGEIRIAVQGPVNRRAEFLRLLKHECDVIHSTFSNLEPVLLVPDPEHPKLKPIPLTKLEAHDREGIPSFTDTDDDERIVKVDVKRLLGRLEVPGQPAMRARASRSSLRSDAMGGDSTEDAMPADVDDDRDEPPEPPYVFLSYMSEDVEPIRQLRKALEGAGIRVWWDRKHIPGGKNWRSVLKIAIKKASAFVSCWSTSVDARDKTVTCYELKEASPRQADKLPSSPAFIFPARLEKCEVPDIEVCGDLLSDLHAWDLFGKSAGQNLKRLIKDLKKALKPEG
ncbi:MAG: TIR domain-containing protein [Verrucomicrobiaceae bacterium]|nr:TIR domain-containing protein [Verrucomicrobiaceae bacterium]